MTGEGEGNEAVQDCATQLNDHNRLLFLPKIKRRNLLWLHFLLGTRLRSPIIFIVYLLFRVSRWFSHVYLRLVLSVCHRRLNWRRCVLPRSAFVKSLAKVGAGCMLSCFYPFILVFYAWPYSVSFCIQRYHMIFLVIGSS